MLTRRILVAGLVVLSLLAPVSIATADAATPQSCSFPVSVTDATGTEVTLPAEPERVVSLSPSAAQTMWEIGARDRVVGVTKHASYLDGADSRTTVSTSEQMVSVEAVVGLEPDLVLAPNITTNATIGKLRDADLTVYHFSSARTVEDVYEKTRLTGRLTGACAGAAETVSWMRERIAVAREASEGAERPDILYLFFGHTAGEGTFIDEILTAGGGNNLAAELNVTGYRQVNAEAVVDANPEWIVRNSDNPVGLNPAAYNRTTAARENQTVELRIEHVNQPAPRIVHAVTTLAERFHPEAYAAANASAMATEPSPATELSTTASTPSSTGPGTTATATTGGEPTQGRGPGFGAAVAILGILVTMGLGARRR